MTAQSGWGRVIVEGDSMLPTLKPGDRCLVKWGAQVQVGDVVVARRPDRPETLVVKRLTAHESDGFWLEGDNSTGSHDSWVFGAVQGEDLLGVVRWRYWRALKRVKSAVAD